eukprot:9227303-Lingulodinium_polyedra.AAC.1
MAARSFVGMLAQDLSRGAAACDATDNCGGATRLKRGKNLKRAKKTCRADNFRTPTMTTTSLHR